MTVKGKHMKKKLVPIIIVVVAVIAAFCVYYFVIRPGSEEQPEVEATVTLEDMYYYVPGEYFVTNINDSSMLCKTSVSLALSGDDQTAFLEKNNAVIRNAVIKVLISHTENEMREVQAIDSLESEMTNSLKTALDIEGLEKVYISDFVIQ